MMCRKNIQISENIQTHIYQYTNYLQLQQTCSFITIQSIANYCVIFTIMVLCIIEYEILFMKCRWY